MIERAIIYVDEEIFCDRCGRTARFGIVMHGGGFVVAKCTPCLKDWKEWLFDTFGADPMARDGFVCIEVRRSTNDTL